jgi:hypothetical protein
MKNPKRGTFLKLWRLDGDELDPVGSVPREIGRLKLPALPVGSMFSWYFDRVDKQRCQVAESRRRSADRRQRKAATMRRYRAKLRAARPDLKAPRRRRS